MRQHPDAPSRVLSAMSDQQLADALAATEAHLARRPSWKVGEACVRLLVGEQKRRNQKADAA